MHCKIASEIVWWWWGVALALIVRSWHWLIGGHSYFISNTAQCQHLGAELVPFACNDVVVVLKDEPALLAGHGVFD